MAAEAPIEHDPRWPVVSLAEIANKIGSGATPKGGADVYLPTRRRYALVRSQNVFDRRFDHAGLAFITDEQAEGLRGVVLQPADILLNITGDGITFGRACMVPNDVLPACVNQHVSIIRVDAQRADAGYVLAFLTHADVKSYIESFNAGGSRRAVTKGHIESFRLPLPPLSEQRAIAHILGTLDDKIELNRRMSETLEAMARALFESWFVDFDPVRAKAEGRAPDLPQPLADLFPARLVDSELGEIPEGWEAGPLSEFFAIGLGGAWGEDEQSTRATVAVRCLRGIDCHDLAEGRIPDVPMRWVSPKQAADRELTEGAILVEGSGSFCGRSMIWRRAYGSLLGGPVGYSNFCKRLDPRCTAAQAGICWMQMRQAYRDGLLQSFRTGTAFPNFDVHGALSNLIVVMPPAPLAAAFGEMFALSQRLDLMAQSRTLAALRDALLPKLISGELRVRTAEHFRQAAA